MANTYVDYTATAAQTDFAFNFPYLEDEHVTVEINGVATTLFSIVTSPALKVVLDSGAAAGDVVRIRRRSQRDTNLVDFQNGSVLTEAELDRAYLHNRYLAEEISELNDQSLQVEAGGTEWDAKGLRIKNVGTPTDTTDASTKIYVDNKVNQLVYGGDAPLKWQFTGTAGANTIYTVTGAEISGDTAYDVSINGLVQEPGVDFTVNPNTDKLTIVPTLSGGEDIVIIQRGFGVAVTGTVGTNSLVDGSVTTAKLADDAVDSSKLDETDTYTVNGLSVTGDIDITGDYKKSGVNIATVPTGTVSAFAGSSAPFGYLICDGSEYSETTYADLFTVLGSTYNTGGETANHFRVPDLQGRVIAGLDSSAGRLTDPATTTNGIDGTALGNTGGEEDHLLSNVEMNHQHNLQLINLVGGGGSVGIYDNNVKNLTSTADNAHNNVQPTIILNYIIKT